MKKILGSILLVIYSVIAITVTILLLSYNEYNCSEIGGYTIYLVNDDSLEPEYKQGSILLIKHTSDKNVQKGDEMFLYKVINSQEFEFINRTLADKVQQGNHITYVVDNGENYANDYFVGKTSDTVVIEGWGYILSLLESKWGYLFCVVIVSLMLFLQEVFELGMEIKYGREVKKARMEKQQAGQTVVENVSNVVDTTDEVVVKPKTTNRPKTSTTTRTTNATKTRTSGTRKTTTASKTGTAKSTKTVSKKSVKSENNANSEEK